MLQDVAAFRRKVNWKLNRASLDCLFFKKNFTYIYEWMNDFVSLIWQFTKTHAPASLLHITEYLVICCTFCVTLDFIGLCINFNAWANYELPSKLKMIADVNDANIAQFSPTIFHHWNRSSSCDLFGPTVRIDQSQCCIWRHAYFFRQADRCPFERGYQLPCHVTLNKQILRLA